MAPMETRVTTGILEPREATTRLAQTGVRLERSFADSARRVRKQADTEAIHDLRVIARQLDALLGLCRVIVPRPRRRRTRRALRSLRRGLGAAREAQVNVDVLKGLLSASAPPDPIATVSLVDRFERRQARLEDRAARACSKPAVARVSRCLERIWAGLGTLDARALSLEGARSWLQGRAAAAHSALDAAFVARDKGTLHQARLAVKRWRYGAEALARVTPTRAGADRIWLRSVQESLGHIHDLQMLAARLGRLMREDALPAGETALAAALVQRAGTEQDAQLGILERIVHGPEGPRALPGVTSMGQP